MRLKLILPAAIGTIVEYYDYALYGFSADRIAEHFFPNNDPTIGLLKVYGIFIAGSCSKPLGSLLFGYIGDRYGRSLSLRMSMLGIAFPTLLVGLMPGYEILGWWAALFLLLCRVLQGMFVSGESDGVRIFIYESLGKSRPCFSNSISGMACMMGVYIASCVSAFSTQLSISEFAWRIPFLMGGLAGVGVLLLRRYLSETPEFTQYRKQHEEAALAKAWGWTSLWRVIVKNKQAVFVTILLYGIVGGGYHFYFVFFGKYISATLQVLEADKAALLTAHTILVYLLCAPLAGYVADRFGALRALKLSALVLMGLIIVNGILLAHGVFPTWIWFLTAINLAFLHTPGFVVLFEKFSVGERFRCVSIGHAIGSMLLSGTAPFISLWIWQVTRVPIAPLGYFMMLTLLGYYSLTLCEKRMEPPVTEPVLQSL